jgi:hypothetical protein
LPQKLLPGKLNPLASQDRRGTGSGKSDIANTSPDVRSTARIGIPSNHKVNNVRWLLAKVEMSTEVRNCPYSHVLYEVVATPNSTISIGKH